MTEDNYLKIFNFMEELYKKYNVKAYIATDPIRFAHELEGNREFIAFTSSCFAYGNMKAIQGFLFRYFEYAGTDPLKLNDTKNDDIYYRFETSADVVAYSRLMKKVYDKYGSIEALFKKAGVDSVNNIAEGIKLLRTYADMTNGLNFLMPIPDKSASKRLNMFVRWMIRADEVDLGLWNLFDKSNLYMPADTHILRMATNMGIIKESQKGKDAVLKVTDIFRKINSADPAKYDFSLTRLGIVSGCQYSLNARCCLCLHNITCLFN